MTVIDTLSTTTATVTRDGKKIVIAFDADIAEGLAMESGAKMKISRQGKQIVIEEAPATAQANSAATDFQTAMRETASENAELFRRLAK